ncbi:MAG: hypothetical protein WCL06_02115 [Bacteroidota bacterium]
MKRTFLLLLLLLGGAIFLCSCKKCITCTAYDRVDNSQKNQQNFCGPGSEANEFEKNYVYIWNDTQTFADCK